MIQQDIEILKDSFSHELNIVQEHFELTRDTTRKNLYQRRNENFNKHLCCKN